MTQDLIDSLRLALANVRENQLMASSRQLPPLNTVGLGKIMRRDSERWFPELHKENKGTPLYAFYALALAGEVGEVANEVKKNIREVGGNYGKLGPELADVFTYLLLLADELGINLFLEYLKKREVNEERWGNPE